MIIDIAKAVPIETEIARRGGLGLKRIGGEFIGACPQCGGRDRFAVSVRKQCFLCRGCGRSGDVIALVQHLDGANFKDAVKTLAGDEPRPIIRPAPKAVAPQDDAANTVRALALWEKGSPIEGTLAETYLQRRGLVFQDPDGDVLRFCGGCPFGDSRYACLLALYRDIKTDAARAISRTALGPGGMKIERKALGPVMGAAVKIDCDATVERGLVIGEGIETCVAARMLGLKPCWALGSAGPIRSFPLLGGVECLSIIVDNDPPDDRGRRAGPEAAAECSARWIAAGAECRRIVPRRIGNDMADLAEVCHG